jgi:hypothetical protein
MKNNSGSWSNGSVPTKETGRVQPTYTAQTTSTTRTPASSTGKPTSGTVASGKPKQPVKNTSTAGKGKNDRTRPGTKPDKAKRDKLTALAGKITSAVLSAALTNLANGIDPGAAGLGALDDCIGQDDCPFDASEQGVIRECMSAWETPIAGGDAVEGGDAGESGDSAQADESMPWQNARYLRLKNDTSEKLTIYVQVRTEVNNAFTWLPADPETSKRALVFELQPGEDGYLPHDGDNINGCRVRLWAKSASGLEWTDYKDEDLWLVPECNDKGERFYYTSGMETLSYSFEG